ncbi:Short-chain dehydrogenase [Apiospora rasikravindrae]|uniref:Short-chain dehydrogenase n=1 Tax=Apiospora rasikravindrae TaxID=990691 RepID=A0ABR1RX43_9PEZI
MGFLYSQLVETRALPYPKGSQAGKTVVITGSNTGLGKEAARHFARLGASRLILAVRNVEGGEAAKRDILESTQAKTDIQVWQLDMASYANVKAFAARVAAELDRIDIFIENAGLAKMAWSTAEDNETQITVNVVSTMLLAALVLPKLKKVATALGIRPTLTLTSSGAHAHTQLPHAAQAGTGVFATLNDKAFTEAHWAEQYPASKLLPIFHVRSIAERTQTAADYPVTINLANPGLCESGLAREAAGMQAVMFFVMKGVLARTTEQGSRTIFHAATQGAETHGQYMSDCRIDEPSETVTKGKELQDRLWEELVAKLEKIEPGVTKNFV